MQADVWLEWLAPAQIDLVQWRFQAGLHIDGHGLAMLGSTAGYQGYLFFA